VAAAWPDQNPAPAGKRPALPLLGLLDQQYHVCQPVPEAEKAQPHGGSRPHQHRVRESALWTQRRRAVGRPPANRHWVVVADRGADSYAHVPQCQARGLGFVVCASGGRVWEGTGPAAAPGLEWRLLSDQPVTDLAQALNCVRQYTRRWLMEDFHKALKTGLGPRNCRCKRPAASSRWWPC